jgi:hypothetical protein
MISFVAAAWGCPGNTFADKCKILAEASFEAVEVQPEDTDEGVRKQGRICSEYGLGLILQPHSKGSTPEEHIQDMKVKLSRAELLEEDNLWFISAHTGLDHFSIADNLRIADVAHTWQEETGIEVLHEVHRKRIAYNAMVGAELCQKAPYLRYTADFSHWVVVHENYLMDPSYQLGAMLPKCNHIHARVGHPQAPQVSDPRAPEWGEALNFHFAWWDGIVDHHRKANTKRLTICPEFGPADSGYCPTLPYTRQPLADVFEINCWMRDLLSKRYN